MTAFSLVAPQNDGDEWDHNQDEDNGGDDADDGAGGEAVGAW